MVVVEIMMEKRSLVQVVQVVKHHKQQGQELQELVVRDQPMRVRLEGLLVQR